jgi:hypothetical protein
MFALYRDLLVRLIDDSLLALCSQRQSHCSFDIRQLLIYDHSTKQEDHKSSRAHRKSSSHSILFTTDSLHGRPPNAPVQPPSGMINIELNHIK